MKLADVLWEAANVRLSPTDGYNTQGSVATCCAAYYAEFGHDWCNDHRATTWGNAAKRSEAVMFLKSLGCKVGSSDAFNRFEAGDERQGVRYMWLLLAMHVAEDEGITL